MTDTTASNAWGASFPAIPSTFDTSSGSKLAGAERVNQLLVGLQELACDQNTVNREELKHENHLAVVRLGIATSLFYALRAKHAASASHSLRVSLACSAWAHRLGLAPDQRDRVEVAALLHDIGKIGIPDHILRKPGKLTREEQLLMDGCSVAGCEILRGCSADQELLDIIRYSNVWYESRRFADKLRGDAIPLGARLLAIADAYDSMTTEHVYRRALSRERALEQLINGSGTQFDPELARDYSNMIESHPNAIQSVVMDRWLQQLQPSLASGFWTSTQNSALVSNATAPSSDAIFYRQLLEQTNDGVAFTDNQGMIVQWNAVLEQLTGIPCDAVLGKSWNCETLKMITEAGPLLAEECPVRQCLQTHVPATRSMLVKSATGEAIPVQLRVSAVAGDQPGAFGAVVVIRDFSDQASLQRRLESLHEQVTRDPLTGVSNRCGFDRRLAELCSVASGGGETFSLIICDIDHFKRVNDVYGHPAGDEALVNFAAVLSSFSREGDSVARYGGEEFVFLATGCDNEVAAQRADAIRKALEITPLPSLGGSSVTASFGVTQFQAGDTAQTILARADRALLRAKDTGRNRVIQLGVKNQQQAEEIACSRGWLSWFSPVDRRPDREVDISTPVPVDVAVEKLKGFIADHDAVILNVSQDQVSLRVNSLATQGGRRRVDQILALNVTLTLSESKAEGNDPRKVSRTTVVHVVLKPIRSRDRRSREMRTCTDQVIASLKSYLMGELVGESEFD